ncbi:DHHW family protein [Flavobacterium sp.]|jgi:hypothetical protein|uniref:DHHW family protein n=1 Tax=Flavobacterium sp. TaxID=239 RepID=UPI0037C09EB4
MKIYFISFYSKLNSFLFVLILIIVGLLFIVLPKEKISENEKRVLKQFPDFTKVNLFSGKYFEDIDLYYSDNFIFRNTIIEMASEIKKYKGIKNKEIQYFTKTKAINKLTKNTGKSINFVTSDDEKIKNVENSSTIIDTTSEAYNNINSVIVYKRKAIQIYSGSKKKLSSFASLVSKYKTALGSNVTVFCMALPVGSDFNLPNSFKKDREKTSINYLYNVMNPSIKCVYAYEELEKHQNEYIQFNTDHHWTGRGAYYAYLAFCKSAGLEPLPIDKFEIKKINNFLGTLYYYTRSEDLKKNKDYVEYFKIPNRTKATYFDEKLISEKRTLLYAEYARGGNSYGVFLGGDYPLMHIKSDVKNGQKILIIKDSYGNAFAPFLCAHYEDVYIVDYRYLKYNIKSIMKKFDINNIIFAHNLFVLNSSYTTFQESKFLNSNFISNPAKPQQVVVKKDTLTNNKNEKY